MPVMDGFQATQEIRAWHRQNRMDRVPIVALTAHALQGYHEKCLQHDMDDYLSKPLRKAALLAMVKKWIKPPPVTVVDENPQKSDVGA